MEAFNHHTGIVSPLDRMNVDTDAIIPKQFLKRIERTGFGEFLFYELRFDEKGQMIKSFALNQSRYQGTSILISRANFGCGSSREHAPWALLDYGYKVIIASSFADIFYNNCFNNGILPIILDPDTVDLLLARCAKTINYALTVDLNALTIHDEMGFKTTFKVDSFRQNKLLKGLDDISMTLENLDDIIEFEKDHQIF